MFKKIVLFVLYLGVNVGHAQTTTCAASYAFRGGNVDQTEIQFYLETTYKAKARCAQLYRWRYAMGNFNGLIFEYNNRFYFGKNRRIENSRWFFESKVGHGLLKGKTYQAGELLSTEANGDIITNITKLEDKTHYIFDYGISMGYKWVWGDFLSMDISMGYVDYTLPNFESYSPQYLEQRKKDWDLGMGSNFEFQWSLGFFFK